MRIESKIEIVPGIGIGEYLLEWDFNTLKNHISNDFQIDERTNCYVVNIPNYKFWIDKSSNIIYQISVYDNLEGRFLGIIGIGSTLKDVEEHIGKWVQEFDTYTVPHYPGICFELVDEDDWEQQSAPIEFISVYV